MAVKHVGEVPATFVPSIDQVFKEHDPGFVCFYIPKDGDYIFTECPCGCGGHMRLPIYTDPCGKPAFGAAWHWNGDRQSPTLDPSIRDLSGCRFHGFLRNGVWTFCGDSGIGV